MLSHKKKDKSKLFSYCIKSACGSRHVVLDCRASTNQKFSSAFYIPHSKNSQKKI